MRSLQPPIRTSMDTVAYRPQPIPTFLGYLLSFWTSEVALGLHRLELIQRCFGIIVQRQTFSWDEVDRVDVVANRLVLRRRRGRSLMTFVTGDPGQLAWIAGAIKGRLQEWEQAHQEADSVGDLRERARLATVLASSAAR